MAHIFVSDVHLDAGAPAATARFLDFLSTHAARAEALYILGDLFEAWIGDDDREPDKARVCDALRAITSQGVACFVLHGNRDFLLGKDFCRRTGSLLLPDPIVVELDGERVLLTHGDALCTDDHSYQELRAIVRKPGWQRRYLGLPLEDREQLANRARAGSRAHTSRTDSYIMDVNPSAVEAAFRATDVKRMIHGHTHRPGMHELSIDGKPVQRIVLGAWYEQGSYLVHDAGTYELKKIGGVESATSG